MHYQKAPSNGGSSLEAIIQGYVSVIDSDLAVRLDACLGLDLDVRPREVLGSLLARQGTLTKTIASTPNLWTAHSADLVLRAMAEVHVTVAWLLAGGPERYQQYIDQGVNQAVRDLRCREAVLGDKTMSAEDAAMLRDQREWISQQCVATACSGNDERVLPSLLVMAADAHCLEFFATNYPAAGGCTHSMWHHVEHYNLVRQGAPGCSQPRRGVSPEPQADLGYLLLAARYWTMTVQLLDECIGSPGPLRSHRVNLLAALTTGSSLDALET